MAAQGKGKRRVKGKTLDLSTFLGGNQDAPMGYTVVNTRSLDWGEAMENEELDENKMLPDKFTLDFKRDEKIVLPTAPKSARGPDIDINSLPTKPPYTAYLGNLPYDVTEEDILRFFRNLQVKEVRLPREGGERGRMKGYGYAEFPSRDILLEALALNNETLKSRSIRISLAEDHGDSNRDRRNDDNRGPDRTAGDWRAAPREDSFGSRDNRYNSAYEREPYRGRGSYDRDRDRDSGYGRDRYNRFDRGNSSDRDWDRGGGFRDSDRDRKGFDRGPDRGFGGDRFRERDSGRGGFDSHEREPRTAEGPKERPKLQLKPRTQPIDPVPAPAQTSSAIFGGAKPVDTAAKEREIEERLARQRELEEKKLQRMGERERDEPRMRKTSSGSGPSRSRRSSESGQGTSYKDSQSEDEMPSSNRARSQERESRQPNTLPRTRQRRSVSSTSSDRETSRELQDGRPPSGRRNRDEVNGGGSGRRKGGDYNDRPMRNQQQDDLDYLREPTSPTGNRSGEGSVRYGPKDRDKSRDRPPKPPIKIEDAQPPVRSTINKFSHLKEEDDI